MYIDILGNLLNRFNFILTSYEKTTKKQPFQRMKSIAGVSMDYHNSFIFIFIHLMGFYFNASVIELCLIFLFFSLSHTFSHCLDSWLSDVDYTVIWYVCSLFEVSLSLPLVSNQMISNMWYDNNFIFHIFMLCCVYFIIICKCLTTQSVQIPTI